MRTVSPLAVFAVLMTAVGLYDNWSAAFTQAWCVAALGGVVLAVLYFFSSYAGVALGVIALALLAIGIADESLLQFFDKGMASGLACGLLLGLGAGFFVKRAVSKTNRSSM